MRIDHALLGAHVRRVAQPAPQLLALELSSPAARGWLLLGVAAGARGLGWFDDKIAGSGADPWLLKWKRQLVGGRVVAIAADDLSLRLELQRDTEHVLIEARFDRDAFVRLNVMGGALIAELTAQGRSVRAVASASQQPQRADGLDLDALRARAGQLLQGGDEAQLESERLELARAAQQSIQRAERKLRAIEGDLQRADEVPRLRRDGGLVLSHLHALPPNCVEARLVDYSRDPPAEVELHFEPQLGPKLQAEAWFRRARKLERGMAIASERATATRALIAALELLRQHVQQAQSSADLEACRQDASRLGTNFVATQAAPGRAREEARLPYREFRSGQRAILVGRGSKDNDRLTLDHSQPHDLWLHARDLAGAHVVIPLARNEDCPPELLVDAATLAAHFSHERGQAMVDVLYTPRRYVRKPRKSAAGQVTLVQEKVLRLRLEPDRLQRLLAAEQRPADRKRDAGRPQRPPRSRA